MLFHAFGPIWSTEITRSYIKCHGELEIRDVQLFMSGLHLSLSGGGNCLNWSSFWHRLKVMCNHGDSFQVCVMMSADPRGTCDLVGLMVNLFMVKVKVFNSTPRKEGSSCAYCKLFCVSLHNLLGEMDLDGRRDETNTLHL